MSLPVPMNLLREVAESIMLRAMPHNSDPPELGPKQSQRFIKRHGIKKIKQKPIELARKEAHSPELIRRWFRILERELKDNNIKP